MMFMANIKWIAIGVIVLVLALGFWRYTYIVGELATAQQTISILEDVIESKERAIEIEKNLRANLELQFSQVEEQKESLEEMLRSITRDLPEDELELAPESTREILRRLMEE